MSTEPSFALFMKSRWKKPVLKSRWSDIMTLRTKTKQNDSKNLKPKWSITNLKSIWSNMLWILYFGQLLNLKPKWSIAIITKIRFLKSRWSFSFTISGRKKVNPRLNFQNEIILISTNKILYLSKCKEKQTIETFLL